MNDKSSASRPVSMYLLLAAIVVTAVLIFVIPTVHDDVTSRQYLNLILATAAVGIVLFVGFLVQFAIEGGTRLRAAVATVGIILALLGILAASPLPDFVNRLFYGGLERILG